MTEKKPSPSRKALKLRARARNKKPKFLRAESWKYDRFSTAWRKPRGLDNKIRRKIKGWPPGPSMGYKGPKIARFLHPIRLSRSHRLQRTRLIRNRPQQLKRHASATLWVNENVPKSSPKPRNSTLKS